MVEPSPSIAAHLQVQTRLGTFVLGWNASHRVVLNDWHPAVLLRSDARAQIWSDGASTPASVFELARALVRYFEQGEPMGEWVLEHIDDARWSEFQRRVYRVLCSIPHGETRTYAWVAERAGSPGAPRAVGQALRCNPVPVMIPCHRVVSSSDLGGFMGESDPAQPALKLKRGLIELEAQYLSPMFSFVAPPAAPSLEWAHA